MKSAFLKVGILSLLAACFVIPAQAQAAEPRVLIYSEPSSPDNNLYKSAEFFAKRVKELSNGTLEFEIHHNGVLGTETQNVDNLKLGSIDIGQAGSNNLAGFTDAFLVGDLPYIFQSIESSHKVWWGPVGQEIIAEAEKDMGVRVLGTWDNGCGYRYLTNNKHEVRVPADTKDLKLRIAGSPIEESLYKKWGASGTPVPWGETYSALEQKVIDGQLLHAAWIYWAKHYEALKYLTDDANGICNQHVVMMSKPTWNSLTPEQQKAVMQAFDEAQKYNAKISAEMSSQFLKLLTEKCGMKYYKPTEEERKLWSAAAQAVWPDFAKKIPADLIERVVAAQK
ncbi:MAG: TRAP transporter substrate-binding protein [Mailhella sp.]|nr:TRAP transporter substrate-binding protein [Mailhella sp.]